MSLKAMAFIDGTWLYRSREVLFAKLGEANGCEIDYANLPRLFSTQLAKHAGTEVDLVRTHYFGTIPASRPGYTPLKQESFYEFLEKTCGYETDIAEVPVGGDSHLDDSWVKMALGASLLINAALPGAFDVAILIGDNLCYEPVLGKVRLYGKRIQLVSAHTAEGTLPQASLAGKSRFLDFPTLYLDEFAENVRLVRERVTRVCKNCGATEETTWAGPEFFCSNCRGKHRVK